MLRSSQRLLGYMLRLGYARVADGYAKAWDWIEASTGVLRRVYTWRVRVGL